MAKESMKARERKREALVAKYAAKRAALKEAGDYECISGAPSQSLQTDGSPTWIHASVRYFTRYVPRNGPQRPDPRSKEEQLVTSIEDKKCILIPLQIF